MNFTEAVYTVPEDTLSVEVCVVLRGELDRNVAVSIVTSEGTACKAVSSTT